MIQKAQSLKSNPVFLVGVVALAYGAFLFSGGGLTLKAVVCLGIGAYLIAQKITPAMASKIKNVVVERVKAFIKSVIENREEIIDNVMGAAPEIPATISSETLTIDNPVEHRVCFRPCDFDAIAHLAFSAKKEGNEQAVEQLRAVNNEFFNISLKRVDDNKEDDNEVV